MRHAIGLALAGLGCAVVLAACLGALVSRGDVFLRLHFVTPVTSLGVPLIAVGLSVESGQPYVVAELLVIALLLFVAGPVVDTAVGRVAAQNRGIDPKKQPQ
jgi:monovalent cation/proton antiporter MnhG/PhaG subunit